MDIKNAVTAAECYLYPGVGKTGLKAKKHPPHAKKLPPNIRNMLCLLPLQMFCS